MSMPLENARLCLDCDTVFDEPRCPSCDSVSFFPLSRWVRPAVEPSASAPGRPNHSARNTSLALGGVGLAYAVWRFLGAPARKPPIKESPRRKEESASDSEMRTRK
jgi:hypothetical protein